MPAPATDKEEFTTEMQDLVVQLIEDEAGELPERTNLDLLIQGVAERTWDEIIARIPPP